VKFAFIPLPQQLRQCVTGYPMAVVILACYGAMAVSSELGKSVTFDEIVHLTGGYSYWLTADYRLHPENGVLPQRWVSLPLLLGDYRFPDLFQPAWRGADALRIGDQFLHQLGNPLESMLLQGRAMMALAGAGLGLLVYAWSRSLFGPAGGTVSLLLFAFCPSMLAHGSLMTSDLFITLTLTASVWCFWAMLRKLSTLSVLSSSVVMGLAFVSKNSAVLILPMALALVIIHVGSRSSGVEAAVHSGERHPLRSLKPWAVAAALTVHLIVVVAVIWSFYGFRYSAFGPLRQDGDRFLLKWEVVLADSGPSGTSMTFVCDHRLLPEAYLYGLAYTLHRIRKGAAFLNGQYSMTGWWYFFPYAALVKTPLPLFAILGLALTGAVLCGRSEATERFRLAQMGIREGLYRTAPLWVLLLVYWTAALGSTLNVGHRYILPTYPAMFILAGAAAYWLRNPNRLARGLLLACLVWFVVESWSIRPHYLAYFNQVAGGPSYAYRHLVDGSLDWGQDLPGLKRWLEQNGLGGLNPTPVYLAYFGKGSPDYYRIEAHRLPVSHSLGKKEILPLSGGVYCISATMLQAVYLKPGGNWRPLYEQVYRQVLADMERYAQTSGDREARARLIHEKGQAFWVQQFKLYDQLRFGRLVSYLRQREPDDNVGYSILIYRLSDAQVQEALYGPLAELQ